MLLQFLSKLNRKSFDHLRARKGVSNCLHKRRLTGLWVRHNLLAGVPTRPVDHLSPVDVPRHAQAILAWRHRPRHQIGVDDVVVAALMLKVFGDGVGLVPLAAPRAVGHGRAVRAGAAVGVLGWLGLVTEGVGWAEAALIPRGVRADRWRDAICQSDALASGDGSLSHVLVVPHPLGVQAVIVLADGHVKRAVDIHAVHVDLHLGEVHRLGLLHAVLDHVLKGLLGVRLELGHVPLLGGLWHAALNDAVKAARDVATKIDTRLTGLNVDACALEVGNDRGLLVMSAPEQAKDAPLKLLDYSMAEGEPKPPLAVVA